MITLWPNVGAEEPGPLPPAARAATDALVRTWAALFGAAARLDDVVGAGAPSWPWLVAGDDDALVPWLSTTAARDEAHRRGLRYAACDPDVVARVHDKAFAIRTARARGLEPAPLAGLATVFDPTELDAARIEAIVAAWPQRFRASFTCKPRMGTSGRGRVAGKRGVLDEAARRALPRLAARGGCIVEPWLARIDDLSSCWHTSSSGVLLLGTTRLRVSGAGVHRGNDGVVVDGLLRSGYARDEALVAAARVVVEAARDEGYRGPCGVDAFTFTDEGALHLRAVVELNARFTAGVVACGERDPRREFF